MTIVYHLNGVRIREDLAKLEAIGSSQKGVTRLAFTDAEHKAHSYIKRRMEAAGMQTWTDGFGNLYGRLDGRGKKSKDIRVGSHLDTVPSGGNYDGAAGVVVGLEAARNLKGELEHDLVIVAFRAEESSRFHNSCNGSKWVTGYLNSEQAKRMLDKDGTSLYNAVRSSGFDPSKNARWGKSDTILYIEPHIEQGRVLQEAGLPLGIPTGIAAPVRYIVEVTGRGDHSGATPMGMRKDALTAFSVMCLAIESAAQRLEQKGYQIRATVGDVHVRAGAINKVPGKVTFPVDIRSTRIDERDELEKLVQEAIENIARQRGVSCKLRRTERGTPVELEEENYLSIEQAARSLRIPTMRLPSGAGHDAQYIAQYGIPTAMIFIRNSGGSHDPREGVRTKDLVLATKVLAHAITKVDEIDK